VSAAPPRLGRALLWLALPAPEREAVAGDLHEEFLTVVVPRRGARRARGWYWGQVLRSLGPLLALRWQRRSRVALLAGSAAAVLATLPPLLLGEALRRFVLSQVPLRASGEPGAGYVAGMAALGLLLAGLGARAGAHWVGGDSGGGDR
jgi:hypothetical protein